MIRPKFLVMGDEAKKFSKFNEEMTTFKCSFYISIPRRYPFLTTILVINAKIDILD